MNTTPTSAVRLARAIVRARLPTDVETVLCPPAISVPDVARAVTGTSIRVGVQNVNWREAGAYTGEISLAMLEGVADFVIIGHSERRSLFGETDKDVNRKLAAVLNAHLTPIVCVGETGPTRDAGETQLLVTHQVRAALDGIKPEPAGLLVLAYEPVWAIGTGRTATPDQAAEAVAWIREALESSLTADAARRTRVLYGGSVTAGNAREILAQDGIDGALVGSASLQAPDFAAIAQSAAA
jgi:triosephosphate isomerase